MYKNFEIRVFYQGILIIVLSRWNNMAIEKKWIFIGKDQMLGWKEKSEIRFVYLCKCDRNKFAVSQWNELDFLRRVIKNDRKTKHQQKAGCPFFNHKLLFRAFNLCALYFIVERSRCPSSSNIWICHRNMDVFIWQMPVLFPFFVWFYSIYWKSLWKLRKIELHKKI